jgi:hypothetical protein
MTAEHPQGDQPLIPMPALSLPAWPASHAGDALTGAPVGCALLLITQLTLRPVGKHQKNSYYLGRNTYYIRVTCHPLVMASYIGTRRRHVDFLTVISSGCRPADHRRPRPSRRSIQVSRLSSQPSPFSPVFTGVLGRRATRRERAG